MVDSNFLSFGDRGRGRRCEHEVARRLVRLEQRGLRSSGRGGREPDLQGLENTWEGWSDQMGKVKVYPYEGLKGLCGEGIMIRSGSDLEFMSITPTGVREELQELQGKELGGYWVVQAKDDRLGGHRDAENLMDPERVWRFKKKKIPNLRSDEALREKRHQEWQVLWSHKTTEGSDPSEHGNRMRSGRSGLDVFETPSRQMDILGWSRRCDVQTTIKQGRRRC